MNALGIALIVIGFALVCGSLFILTRAAPTEERDRDLEQGAMTNVRRRLDEISNENSQN
jgi:hypothetical protein